jgi:MurNAc alpha-1-phosphate uridylyltransferase
LLDPALFAALAPGRRPLKPILDAAIERGELHGLRHDGFWLDVGTPERLALAREKVRDLA